MSAQNVGPVRGAREVTTLFSLDVEIERGGTRWDGRTSHETKFSSANEDREDFFCSIQLTTSRIGNYASLLPSVLNVMTTHPHAWSI